MSAPGDTPKAAASPGDSAAPTPQPSTGPQPTAATSSEGHASETAAAPGAQPAAQHTGGHGHGNGLTKAAIPFSTLLAVLGVVYGDIGTSPLYALRAALEHFADDGLARWEVLGILSMVFWSLVFVVTVKYVTLIMRADNKGEGGILALMALAVRGLANPRLRWAASMIGIAGACLFFGDGTITPAISVLSAMEGLKVISPALTDFVVPLSLVCIVALFMVQYRGTQLMGSLFGPIMALWFAALGILGLIEVVREPGILAALSPVYAVRFAMAYHFMAVIALGSVVLAVTGAEALYADMGHFGRRPIALMWTCAVLPSLTLNYLGQGALILHDPDALANPFFLLAPSWLRLPMVVLSTLATIIASQAMITGAFSIARQCVQLGFLPRLVVRHTSETEEGQIYMPQINFALLIGVVILVLAFRTSDNLAAAYGIAVTGTFICTSILAMVVFRRLFHWPLPYVLGALLPLLALDAVFCFSNVLKVPEGGWEPLALGSVLFTAMSTWKRGRDLLIARFRQDSLPLKSFLLRLPQSRTIRVPGIAVFMTGQADYVPSALLHNMKHNKVLHETVLFVTVMNEDIPQVSADRRQEVAELSPGIYRVLLRYGFQESPNIPRALEQLQERGLLEFDAMQSSYFLGREVLVRAVVPKMSRWRQWVFATMARNAVPATEFFRIPSDRVVELGVRVAI